MANKPQKNSAFIIIFLVFSFFVIVNIMSLASEGRLNPASFLGAIFDQGIFLIFMIFVFLKGKAGMKGKFEEIVKNINKSGGTESVKPVTDSADLMDLLGQALNNPASVAAPVRVESDIEIGMPSDSSVMNAPTTTAEDAVSQMYSLAMGVWPGSEQISRLDRKKKYLQVALNGGLDEAKSIIGELPRSEKIIIEAGTPLIKIHGIEAVRTIRRLLPGAYIVADTKIADLAAREVELFKKAGANAITALGVAPIETLNEFVVACRANNLDAMIDMMNVESSIAVLKKLKSLPEVVILHRGVDETEKSRGKMIPYYQINQIKGAYNLMVAVAGGDSPNEVQSAIFNGADIVVVWKDFMDGQGVRGVAESFLKEIK